MRWTRRFGARRGRTGGLGIPGRILTGLLLGFGVLLVSAAAPEKRLSVYSTAANYSLTISEHHGHEYVGLLELLDPLGTVNAKTDGSRWRIHYNNILGEFVKGRNRGLVQGRDADLLAPFLVENGRGLVPLACLDSLLPRFLGGPVTLHQESGRLFIGSVATHFTAAVSESNPGQLVFKFTAPVNPSVASEPGKVHLTFNHEPLVAPASPSLTFNSKIIPSATYSEGNGAAEITVASSIPLMANFSADGRTITLAPASENQQVKPAGAATPASAAQGNPAAAKPATAPSAVAPPRYFAVVDASHGGNDPGEVFSTTLVEKDITVALARRLRQELQNRGIPTLVLRDSDANLSLDDRAFFANSSHAAIYIAFHAASSGHGVRLYTALLPYSGEDDGPFRSWNTAQAPSIANSQMAASSVAAQLKNAGVAVRILPASLRPLNNVLMPAIAVEVAPQASDTSQLTSPDYQQLIASAVANGVAAARDKLGVTP